MTSSLIIKTARSKLFCLFGAALTILSCSTLGNSGSLHERLTINDFKFGGVDYLIAGDKAIIAGNRALIQQVRGVFYRDGRDIRLFTPECDFDQIARTGHSSSKIHLRTKSITVDGVGFDLDFAHHRVFIRDDVTVRIFHKDKQLLGQ